MLEFVQIYIYLTEIRLNSKHFYFIKCIKLKNYQNFYVLITDTYFAYK